MKNFNLRLFIISSLIIGLLVFISLMAEWAWEDHYPDSGLFLTILAKSYWIFCSPFVILDWILDYKINENLMLVGLTLNTLFLSLLIERLFYKIKKRKFPTVP